MSQPNRSYRLKRGVRDRLNFLDSKSRAKRWTGIMYERGSYREIWNCGHLHIDKEEARQCPDLSNIRKRRAS